MVIDLSILFSFISNYILMKIILSAMLLGLLTCMWGCGQKSNPELYDEVMKVHDEVMPKMNDIYKLKEDLKKQIASPSDIGEEKKKKIESTIVELDSAGESMMVWMRNFNPLPDSLGEDKAREYLENEREKVNKVKDDMLKVIDEAKTLN